jgi:hypothetical protein
MFTLGVDLVSWAQSVQMLAAGLVLAMVAAGLLLAAVVAIRWRLRMRALRREEALHRASLLGPDGTPLPPVSRGLCDHCGKAFERVYNLTTGKRLCEGCYHKPRPD